MEMHWTEQAAVVRKKLGDKAHLLDRYMVMTFAAMEQCPTAQGLERGVTAAGRLRQMCASAQSGHREPEACYQDICRYVRDNPLPYRAAETRGALYYCHLFAVYLPYAEELFIRELEEAMLESAVNRGRLRETVTAMVDGDILAGLVEKLREETSEMDALDAFRDGLKGEYRKTLQTVDPESGLPIHRLLLHHPGRFNGNWTDLVSLSAAQKQLRELPHQF